MHLRLLCLGFAAGASLVMLGRARAQSITLVTGSNSALYADTFEQGANTDTAENDVTSLPYATPTSAADDNASVTITPAITQDEITGTFDESVSATNGDEAAGYQYLMFTAGANVNYSIAGSFTSTGANQNLLEVLTDETTNTDIFVGSDDVIGAGEAFPESGESYTGVLVANDEYEFSLIDELFNTTTGTPGAATLSGSGGIDFTQTPEPTAFVLLSVSSVAMLASRRRRNGFSPRQIA